jgi:hypothetical protein
VIGVIAIIALPTVLLAFLYGQSRIFFVMSRDGLLPRGLSKVNAHRHAGGDHLFTAVLVAALAGVARLDEIAALANAVPGRVRRGGRLPAGAAANRTASAASVRRWLVVGPLALGCIYLFLSLPHSAAVLPAVERDRPGAVLPVQPPPRADREITGSPVVPAAGRQLGSCCIAGQRPAPPGGQPPCFAA